MSKRRHPTNLAERREREEHEKYRRSDAGTRYLYGKAPDRRGRAGKTRRNENWYQEMEADHE